MNSGQARRMTMDARPAGRGGPGRTWRGVLVWLIALCFPGPVAVLESYVADMRRMPKDCLGHSQCVVLSSSTLDGYVIAIPVVFALATLLAGGVVGWARRRSSFRAAPAHAQALLGLAFPVLPALIVFFLGLTIQTVSIDPAGM